MTQFKVEVDQRPFQEVSKKVSHGLENANKSAAVAALTSYRMKTTLGRALPEEDIPDVQALVEQMARNNWLTERDKEWCEKHGINF